MAARLEEVRAAVPEGLEVAAIHGVMPPALWDEAQRHDFLLQVSLKYLSAAVVGCPPRSRARARCDVAWRGSAASLPKCRGPRLREEGMRDGSASRGIVAGRG